MILRVVTLLVFSLSAAAFTPPVSGMLNNIVKDRKPGEALEITLRHGIAAKGDALVDVTEKILATSGRYFFTWTSSGVGGKTVVLKSERRGKVYRIDSESYKSRSDALLRYLTSHEYEAIQRVLLAEKFVRRDQLQQYKEGVTIEGDPKSWDVKNNYKKHPDIFKKRLGTGVTSAVIGRSGDNKRAVYFEKDYRGLARLEWGDGAKSIHWDFSDFSRFRRMGYYPRRMTFSVDDTTYINTQLISVQPLYKKGRSKKLKEWRELKTTPEMASYLERPLRLLLSYR